MANAGTRTCATTDTLDSLSRGASAGAWRRRSRLTSTRADGVANEREYAKDLSRRLRRQAAPGKFGCVQADALWSESERKHLRPGHHWIFEFGEADSGSCEKQAFKLAPRSWKVYEGTRYYDGEAAMVVKRWFHRTDDDASGCTFVEFDPKKHTAAGAPPVALLFNSNKLRGVFGVDKFKQLGRSGMRTRGAGVVELQGAGETRFVLDSENDSSMRDECVRCGSVLQ